MERDFIDSRLQRDDAMSIERGAKEKTTAASPTTSVSMKDLMHAEEQSPAQKKKHRKKKRKDRALQVRLGASPETLITDPDAPPSLLRVLAYGPEAFTEHALQTPEQVRDFLRDWPV